jgi:hypothetical protein
VDETVGTGALVVVGAVGFGVVLGLVVLGFTAVVDGAEVLLAVDVRTGVAALLGRAFFEIFFLAFFVVALPVVGAAAESEMTAVLPA